VNGLVVWFTGLPASGKSTFAERVRDAAKRRGWCSCVLDGDEIRAALVPKPGYEPEARDDFYATLANLAALLARQGMLVLVPATAHLRAFRENARTVAPDFVEVWVNAPQGTAEDRDPKGLYAASRSGHVEHLPGVGVTYEPPLQPDVVASGGEDEHALAVLVELLESRFE
jgi:adenylylsulfate kinase